MKIRTDSRLYSMWLFTFADHRPRWTTRLRFLLRALFLSPLIFVVAVFTMAIGTTIGNMYTILTGRGILVTWDNGPIRVRKFNDFNIFKTSVSSRVMADLFWLCVAAVYFWIQYPEKFAIYALPTIVVIAVFIIVWVVTIAIIEFADWRDYKDEARIRIGGGSSDPRIVIFVDPPSEEALEKK